MGLRIVVKILEGNINCSELFCFVEVAGFQNLLLIL